MLERASNVITLPESTVTFEGDSTFVFIRTDSASNSYERRPVTTGLSDGINIEIKEGVDTTAVVRGAQIMN